MLRLRTASVPSGPRAPPAGICAPRAGPVGTRNRNTPTRMTTMRSMRHSNPWHLIPARWETRNGLSGGNDQSMTKLNSGRGGVGGFDRSIAACVRSGKSIDSPSEAAYPTGSGQRSGPPSTAAQMPETEISGTRPTRLAHAIHSGGFYGAEKVVCDLASEQLACADYAPSLLAILDTGLEGNEVAARAAGLGIPVTAIHSDPGLNFSGLRAYASALISGNVGLVHSHGYKATTFHLCSRWLGLHRVPLVVTAHGY